MQKTGIPSPDPDEELVGSCLPILSCICINTLLSHLGSSHLTLFFVLIVRVLLDFWSPKSTELRVGIFDAALLLMLAICQLSHFSNPVRVKEIRVVSSNSLRLMALPSELPLEICEKAVFLHGWPKLIIPFSRLEPDCPVRSSCCFYLTNSRIWSFKKGRMCMHPLFALYYACSGIAIR